LGPERITLEEPATIRDEIAAVLRKRGGRLRPEDFYDPQRPRLVYEGTRPLRCAPPEPALEPR
jgi:hypothetical protein